MDRRTHRRAVHRAQKALVRSGVTGRVQGVRDALRSPEFAHGFETARALTETTSPLSDMEAVHSIALRVLDEFGVDRRDVLVQFTWDPSTHQLSIYATESPAAAAAAFASVRPTTPPAATAGGP
jgi:hypothetical protein